MKGQTILFLINTFCGMGYSIVAPLFPLLTKNNGINEELLGWIISIYSITSTISTPFIPLICKKISRIKLLYLATFCQATCTLLYGFSNYFSSFYLLIIIIFILRILHGISAGIISTLIYSLTCSLSNEEELQISLGNLELGWSLGISTGPLCASIFYKIGGFSLPFIILGFILYISVYLTKLINFDEKKNDIEIKNDISFIKFIFYSKILIIILTMALGMISCTYYYPSFTNHLINKYNISVSISSLFFVISVIFYAIGIQFLDYLTKIIGAYSIITLGFFFVSISCFFTYPNFPLPEKIYIIAIGFILKGLGAAPLFITPIIIFEKTIIKLDENIDELSANDIASAILNLTFSIGDFLGPVIGGFLSNHYGFYICCFIVSVFNLSCAIFLVFYFYKNIKNDLKKKHNILKSDIDKKNIMELNDFNKSFDNGIIGSRLDELRMKFFVNKKINGGNVNKKKERNSMIFLNSNMN